MHYSLHRAPTCVMDAEEQSTQQHAEDGHCMCGGEEEVTLACPICYEEYCSRGGKIARVLRQCGHDLCDGCIRRALRASAGSAKNIRCPLCRVAMLPADGQSDYMRILTGFSVTGSGKMNVGICLMV